MNCKPGDLAIVISDLFPDNIGLIVMVDGPARWGYGDDWNCTVTGRRLRCIDPDSGDVFWENDGDFLDSQLRPVSGLPINEETRDEVTV